MILVAASPVAERVSVSCAPAKASRLPLRLKRAAAVLLFATAALAGDAAKTRELLAKLSSETPIAERARACQQLAIVGTPEAVPALAALLDDAQLAHYAREALEAMALPESDAALRAALGTLRGLHLVGVINSIGARGDVGAVPALGKLASNADASIAAAALNALARIGTAEALSLVRIAMPRNPAAAEALLIAADRLRAGGRADEAAKLFDDLRASASGQPLLSATRGAILARGAAGVPLLLETLRAREPGLRGVALLAMRELPGEPVTAALVAELDRVPADLQPAFLAALVDRGGDAVVAAVEKRAATGDADSLAALGRIGRDSSVPLLLRALPSSDAAQRSLVLILAPGADAALLSALASADGAAKRKLIAILGDRGVSAATPFLLRLAHDRDPEIAAAALRALAATAQPADLPALVQLAVASADDAQRTLADRAILSASMKVLEPERRLDPLLSAMRQANTPAARVALFRPLGAIVRTLGGGASALAAVKEALHASDPAVRAAAAQCLADWPDATPAVDLLALARSEAEPIRGMVFAGAVRLATNVAAGRDKTPLDVVALLTEANALVASAAERMMVVSALGSVRRVEALRLLAPYLTNDAVRTEAALAVVQIAPALLNGANAAETRRVLGQIAANERDAGVRARAAELLKVGATPKKKR